MSLGRQKKRNQRSPRMQMMTFGWIWGRGWWVCCGVGRDEINDQVEKIVNDLCSYLASRDSHGIELRNTFEPGLGKRE